MECLSFLPERDLCRFVSSRRPGGRFSDHYPLGDVTVMSVDFCQEIFSGGRRRVVCRISDFWSDDHENVPLALSHFFATGFFVSEPTVFAEGRHIRKPFFVSFLRRDVDGKTEGLFCSFFRRCAACRENGRIVFLRGNTRHRRVEESPLLLSSSDVFKI